MRHSPKRRSTIALLAGAAVLLLGTAACANPAQVTGENVRSAAVGPTIRTVRDDAIAAMVPADIVGKGGFTASINPDLVPIKFIDSNGGFAGLVPDLLNAAATVMGTRVTLERGPFDSMVPGLESKRFDVIASIGDFAERRTKIDFIDYIKGGIAILTSTSFPRNTITPPQDLCGLSVAYIRGNAQQGLIDSASRSCVAAGRKSVAGTGYGDGGAALLSVKSGQSAAFWGDSPAMLYNAKTSPELYKVVYQQMSSPQGIGVAKDDPQLRDALRAALLKLVQTGAYAQLLQKWGQQDYGIPTLPLNTGPALLK